MTEPDFEQWAKNISQTTESISEALKQAYFQGYYLGLNQGWAIEQDKGYQRILGK